MSNYLYIPSKEEILYLAEPTNAQKYRSRTGFLELNEEEINVLRASLKKITRRRIPDANDAEDIVQDTLLTMITSCPSERLKKGVLAWSRGILRNKVGNYYRKSQRHDSIKERNPGMPNSNPGAAATPAQETALSNKELHSIIREKLSDFTPEVRRVMELLVSGFEAGEIANRLHTEPYQTVINRLYRGRKKLARELVKCGFRPRAPKVRERKRDEPGEERISLKAS